MATITEKHERIDRITVKITYGIAFLILMILIVYGAYALVKMYRYEETNDAQVEEYINPILSRSTGFVQEIRFTDHQKVQKGDTLVVIDRNETLLQLQEAEATLRAANASLKVVESSSITTINSASVSEAGIASSKAKLWQQEQDYNRYKKLLAEEAVTQQHFESVKTSFEIAKSEYKVIQNTYKTAKGKINDADTQIAVALANVKQKEAVVDNIKLNLTYSVIKAPSDGIMGDKTLQVGQLIQKGQILGFIVDQDQGKWIVANFKETQVANMEEGQGVEISVDAYPNEVFEGKIQSLAPATGSRFSLLPPDNATGNFVKIVQRFPVRILLIDAPEKTKKLHAGMNANVTVAKL
ncbi:HlyD family secretion protein [Flavobacterium frigoris]|uniref:Membrane fusion component of tripartite multidrug resistance system n=1 Tax=Flavobacterium frigoris (strain PS1) TaxID=1086011 RepID=H7FP15_FLAFP|nr:HlyD family secretion protein [Flavobacterium frigoris]EIA09816.1 membrane fusion component of tripartite multidrug resistance system [Flavobacterium frigoris PS1]